MLIKCVDPVGSRILKPLTNSFQSEIRKYVDDIKLKAEDVGQEIQLAKAQSDYHEQQLQTEERKEASASRGRLSKWLSQSSGQIRKLEEEERKRAEGMFFPFSF